MASMAMTTPTNSHFRCPQSLLFSKKKCCCGGCNAHKMFSSRTPTRVKIFRSISNCVCIKGNISKGIKSSFYSVHETLQGSYRRLLLPFGGESRHLSQLISAVGSGLEASITDPKGDGIALKDVKIVVESQDDDKIQVRVDVNGEETEKIYDHVLTNLARTAPPIPGFRRQKGGKTANVPKQFLVPYLGENRVTKFVIQEIVSSTMADYVKKENLPVKKKFSTTQTAAELKSAFTPGKEFGFNATMEIEKSETETTISSSSEV